jgi:hypothetical protein
VRAQGGKGLGALLGLALAAAVPGARAADTLYVVEQVVVSLNASADGSGERVASLKSGDRVELLERGGESVHVRLPDGREGWLRALYVSGDAPLRPRLQQSEAEVTRLKAEVSRLEAQVSAAASLNASALPAAAAPASAEDHASVAPAGLFSPPADSPPRRVWPWAVCCMLLGLLLGFALGWRMLDRSIRKKYGGLKIY